MGLFFAFLFCTSGYWQWDNEFTAQCVCILLLCFDFIIIFPYRCNNTFDHGRIYNKAVSWQITGDALLVNITWNDHIANHLTFNSIWYLISCVYATDFSCRLHMQYFILYRALVLHTLSPFSWKVYLCRLLDYYKNYFCVLCYSVWLLSFQINIISVLSILMIKLGGCYWCILKNYTNDKKELIMHYLNVLSGCPMLTSAL